MSQPGDPAARVVGGRALRTIQATVRRFSPADRDGSVLDDGGRELPFSARAFDASGLRHLRPGQRVRLEFAGEELVLITIATLAG